MKQIIQYTLKHTLAFLGMSLISFSALSQEAQPTASQVSSTAAGRQEEATERVVQHTIKVSNKSTSSLSVTVYIIAPQADKKTGTTKTQLTKQTRTIGPKSSQEVTLTNQQMVQGIEIEPLGK